MSFRVLLLAGTAASLLAVGCTGASPGTASSCRDACSRISNAGIRWDGDFVGLIAWVAGEAEQEVLRQGRECTPELIGALRDPTRWIAAHVLLSMLWGDQMRSESSVHGSVVELNHLRIGLRADGSVLVDPSQRGRIERMWKSRTQYVSASPDRNVEAKPAFVLPRLSFPARSDSHSATTCLAFGPDGTTLASGGDTSMGIKLWDQATGAEVRSLHSGPVWSLAFSPDGTVVAAGSTDGTVNRWDPATGAELPKVSGHSGGVLCLAFSPDGKTLASAGEDRTIKLWDVAEGRELRTLSGHAEAVASLAFNPDGRTLASASGPYDGKIKLWDVAIGQEVRTLNGHGFGVQSVVFSPDGTTLASGGAEGIVRLWDVASGRELPAFKGHRDAVHSVLFSRDGKKLVSGSWDNTIKLWDIATGDELLTTQPLDLECLALSPDGKVLASGGPEGRIDLWDFPMGEQLREQER